VPFATALGFVGVAKVLLDADAGGVGRFESCTATSGRSATAVSMSAARLAVRYSAKVVLSFGSKVRTASKRTE
jgi:hypothetical protein